MHNILQISHEPVLKNFIELCSINALSGEEKPVAEFISAKLRSLGYHPYTDNSAALTKSNTGNLICRIGTGGNFVLLSHMDTARTTQGLKVQIKDGKISSDGTTILGADDRAGIATILSALEYAVINNLKLKDFTVAFTTCEETTLDGSRNIELPEGIRRGFVFDSSYRPGKFIYSSPGAIFLDINIKGRASHSGISPEKGINAITAAAHSICRLQTGRIDEKSTRNFGIINGGTAVNVVPDAVSIQGEIRSFDRSRIEELNIETRKVFSEECEKIGAELTYKDKFDFVPYTHRPESEVYKNISEAITKAGLTPEPIISFGGSDANSLNERKIQTVNIGIGAQNPHANDEFILQEDLLASVKIALSLITE